MNVLAIKQYRTISKIDFCQHSVAVNINIFDCQAYGIVHLGDCSIRFQFAIFKISHCIANLIISLSLRVDVAVKFCCFFGIFKRLFRCCVKLISAYCLCSQKAVINSSFHTRHNLSAKWSIAKIVIITGLYIIYTGTQRFKQAKIAGFFIVNILRS